METLLQSLKTAKLQYHFPAGYIDENCTASRSSSCLNLSGVDPWSACLFGFLEEGRVVTQCPATIKYAWTVVFARLNALFTVVDPTYVPNYQHQCAIMNRF